MLEFTVSSVPVTSIVLSSDTSGTAGQKGQEIQLSVQIQPSNATYDSIEYKIVEAESSKRGGEYIGELDGYTGLLKIAYNGIYPDTIMVVAVVDGQESNALTFTLEKIAVTSIEFVPNQTYLYVDLVCRPRRGVNFECAGQSGCVRAGCNVYTRFRGRNRFFER